MLELQEALARYGVPSPGKRVGTKERLQQYISRGLAAVVALDAGLHLTPVTVLLRPWGWAVRSLLGSGVRRLRHWVVVLAEQRAAGAAILVSTHLLDLAERLADRVMVLEQQGRVVHRETLGPSRRPWR